GPDAVIAGKEVPGGIQYANLEALKLELGYGNDTLTVESTHRGATEISGGDGADAITIKTITGHTTIDAGEDDDTIHVGSDSGMLDQVYGLLTIVGGSDMDHVFVDDSGDNSDNAGTLTRTTLTGLDMPSVEEVQTISVRAESGSYLLATPGFGTDAGLAGSNYVTRTADSATVEIDFDLYNDDSNLVRERLEALYGVSGGIQVTQTVYGATKTYTVTFSGDLAGLDFPRLSWAETLNENGLNVGSLDISPNVEVLTIEDGTTASLLNTVQALTVNAGVDANGTYQIGLRGFEAIYNAKLGWTNYVYVGDQNLIAWTDPIAYNAGAETVYDALAPILNPNNSRNDLPWTNNVSVRKVDNVLFITFQGAYGDLEIGYGDVDTSGLTDVDVVLDTRLTGINYYSLEALDIDLGSGNDRFDVEDTASGTPTIVTTGSGNDTINVYNKDRSLDGILAELTIDAMGGRNTLNVDGSGDTVADTGVLITHAAITGLAPADINYASTGGNFSGGITIWSGTAGDTITVESTHKTVGLRTITTLNTNEGGDTVTVSLDASTDGFFVLNTEEGDDFVYASPATHHPDSSVTLDDSTLPLVIFGGDGADTIYGGNNDDIIIGDLGRVYYYNETGDVATSLGNGAPVVGGTVDVTASLGYQPGADPLLSSRAIRLEGGAENGETWFIAINENGSALVSAEYTVVDDLNETPETIATQLALLLGAELSDYNINGYSVSAEGSRLIITNSVGMPLFTVSHGVTTEDRTDGLIREPSKIFSIDQSTGGEDAIYAGAGSNQIIGGYGADNITAGTGDNVVFGDAGQADYDTDGAVL
ncbi:MAG TPA: hypothetical protein PK983_09750, partial [Syntrophales bacterium]|nr:hypothetical protein [Syntrophales bacterium]